MISFVAGFITCTVLVVLVILVFLIKLAIGALGGRHEQ